MKTETMTPAWVVENFLPDYQERYRDYYEVDIDNDLSPDYELEYPDWIDKHFPEALSELLKAQKQQCADEVKAMIEMEDPHCPLDSPMYVGDEEVVIDFILGADFPEPKNRK